jgi:hypothetical protein
LSVINISTSSTFVCRVLDLGVFFAGLVSYRSAPLKYISRTICEPFIGVITIYAIDVKQVQLLTVH